MEMDERLDNKLETTIAVLERERDGLQAVGEDFIAHLLDIALLELRRRRHAISEHEIDRLRALVEAWLGDDAATGPASRPASTANVIRQFSKSRS
jgi:hypothetical protein